MSKSMNFLLVLFSALTLLFSCGNGDKAKENQAVATDSVKVTDSVAPYAQMQVKENCFIVISKPELKLYVCEVVGDDTVRLVEYPVCMGKNLGQKQKMSDAVCSVDEIERLTGIDFFPALDDALEDRVEASASLSEW